jgi:prolyl 4-hydroxylase
MSNLLPPSFSKHPFKKIKLPENLYSEIIKEYSKMSFKEVCKSDGYNFEWDAYTSSGISIINNNNPYCYYSPLSSSLYRKCYDAITPYIREWSGCEIEETWGYGIRSYVRDSILHLHRDKYDTHILSCIVFVDQKSEENWPLDFFDHQHNHHQVFFEPGDMLLYESLCAHGRLTPFKGDYYRNMYFHWKPKNWDMIYKKYSTLKCCYKSVEEYMMYNGKWK